MRLSVAILSINIENVTKTTFSPKLKRAQSLPRPIAAVASDYPAGQSTRRHSHDRTQLIYAERGVMTVTTAIGVWVIPPERAVWVPAGIEHEVRMMGAVRMRSLFIDPQAATALPGSCTVVTVSPLLRELILHAVELPELYDPAGPDGRLMDVILDQLQSLHETPLHIAIPDDVRLRRITDILLNDPADNRSLEQWAAVAGASSRTLARLFLRETGLTFGAWRQQARLLKALQGLALKQSVTEVAFDLGYESPSAFIAMFRRALGKSPGRYFQGAQSSGAG